MTDRLFALTMAVLVAWTGRSSAQDDWWGTGIDNELIVEAGQVKVFQMSCRAPCTGVRGEVPAGSNIVPVDRIEDESGQFRVGDEVLILVVQDGTPNYQPTNLPQPGRPDNPCALSEVRAGQHRFARIVAVCQGETGAEFRVEFLEENSDPNDPPFSVGLGDRALVQRVPHFTSVVIEGDGTLMGDEWDPETRTGGVLAFRCQTEVTLLDGTKDRGTMIDMRGKGLPGGRGGTEGEKSGEGYDGEGYDSAFIAGGGGGGRWTYIEVGEPPFHDLASAGAGGGNNSAGDHSMGDDSRRVDGLGSGGRPLKSSHPRVRMTLGCGGGGGGADVGNGADPGDTDKADGGEGGPGGGIIYIAARSFEVRSFCFVRVQGSAGLNASGYVPQPPGNTAHGGGGGGGAGGTVWILCEQGNIAEHPNLLVAGGDGGISYWDNLPDDPDDPDPPVQPVEVKGAKGGDGFLKVDRVGARDDTPP